MRLSASIALLLLLTSGATLVAAQSKKPRPLGSRLSDAGKPDLAPFLRSPMNGQITVKNVGSGDAAPSKLTLDCEKVAGPQPGGCPDLPPSAAGTYFDAAFPKNATINVPALKAGASFTHRLAFWNTFKWPSGKYKFTAVADAAHAIPESNTKNNVATSTLAVP